MGTLHLWQDLDAEGRPAPAEYVREVRRGYRTPEWTVAGGILGSLGATRSAEPGLFRYVDPGRGSGVVRAEGYSPGEIAALDRWMAAEERARSLGIPRSARHPVAPGFFIGFAIVGILVMTGLLVAATVGPMRVPGEDVSWIYVPVIAPAILLFVVLLVLQVRLLRAATLMRETR